MNVKRVFYFSFEKLSRIWMKDCLSGCTDKHLKTVQSILIRYVYPEIGRFRANSVTTKMCFDILKSIHDSGLGETVRKTRSIISLIMRYGILLGQVVEDPTRDLTKMLPAHKTVNRPSIIDPLGIGNLMMKIEKIENPLDRIKLKLLALTFVRPGELAGAEWNEIDFRARLWRIPAKRMKAKSDHIVPLSTQALDLLHELRELTKPSDDDIYLFPRINDKTKHIDSGVFCRKIRGMGYKSDEFCAHGFRAMAASYLVENGHSSYIVDKQLSHIDKNTVRVVYQRSELLPERRKMMQQWSNYLDLRCGKAILGR